MAMMKSKLNFKFKFKPLSKKQLQVLFWWQSPKYADKFAIICDGSVRAGKTVIMSMSFVRWAMYNFSGNNFILAGKTIGSLRRNVVRVLKQMLASEGYRVKDNNSENVLTISRNGKVNYFFLFGGKDEASQDLVQGLTATGAFFDEVALMPESFVSQATARLSVEGAKAWFNCNPESPYHWFKLQWIDDLANKNALRIHFLMEDNPSLSSEIINRYKTMYTGVFYQRYILGMWAVADGIIYDNFDKDTMVVRDLPAGFDKYYVSCDYGTQNPTVFLLWGRNNGTWYLIKEYYYSGRTHSRQKTDQQYCDDLKAFLGNIKARIIVDPSAASFIAVLREHGFRVKKAKNDVMDGIRVTQTAMNEGSIKFSENCPNLFKELASYVWDEKAAEYGEDKPVKAHDHACDAMRYFVYMVIYKNYTAKIKERPHVRGL